MSVQSQGYFAGFYAKGFTAEVLEAVSYITDAVNNANDLPYPTGIMAGDLLVFAEYAENASGNPTSAVPSGFTELWTQAISTVGTYTCSFGIADGTEEGATIDAMVGNSVNRHMLMVFRGNVPLTSATPSVVNKELTSTNPTAQTVLASGGTVPLIVFAWYRASAAIDPRTFTPAADFEINSATANWMKCKIYNSAPANVSVDMNDEGTNNLVASCFLEVA